MAISNPTGPSSDDTLEGIRKQLRDLTVGQQSFQTQLNSQPQFIGVTNKYPSGAPAGSLAVRQTPSGSIAFSVATGKGFGAEIPLSPAGPNASSYLGAQTGTGAPTTTAFPVAGNYGWWKNTTTNAWYWTLNFGGVMVFPNFLSIAGTITATQHGNLAGGALHAVATDSVSGFLSSIDHANFAATTAIVSDIIQTGTPSYLVNATSFYVGGVQVLTAQLPATTALSGAATLADVITYINTLRSNLIAVRLQHA